mgnify:CR=1 FL=1
MSGQTVALLHYSCPPVIGGVEFIVEAHADQFVKAGCKVRMIVGEGRLTHPEVVTEVIPEISSSGGPVGATLRELARGKVSSRFEARVATVERKLEKALSGVDVCMMHNVMTMHFNLVLTAALERIMKRLGKKINFVAWTHDLTFADPVHQAHQRGEYPWDLLSRPLDNCRYCAISGQRRKQMKKVFGASASMFPVIPDGIDVPRQLHLAPRVRDLFYEEELAGINIVALTPARILRRKNLTAGIELVAELKRRRRSVRWFITGPPDTHNPESAAYFDKMLDMRKRLKVEKEVVLLCRKFEGKVSTVELGSLYRLSDILLFPSASEGFGLPVLEAGLDRLLLVVSDIPALREVAGENAVYIKESSGMAAVAGRIVRRMSENEVLQYRKKVLSTYSWDRLFERKILPAALNPSKVWK